MELALSEEIRRCSRTPKEVTEIASLLEEKARFPR
jgi:hypothetical protein